MSNRRIVIVVCCATMIAITTPGVAAPVLRVTTAHASRSVLRAAGDAASQAFEEAQRLLLSKGVSAARQAVDLFRSAAEQGNALAEYDLGYCYEAGFGVSADTSQALVWYSRAAVDTEDDDLRSIALSSMQNLADQAPAPATSAPSAPAPAPAAPSAPPPASDDTLPPNVVASLVTRGTAMLRAGDITAARLLFAPAARAGSGEAALSMGESYDQRFLSQIGAKGLLADHGAAVSWYSRAAALGNRDANRLLAGLDQKPVPAR